MKAVTSPLTGQLCLWQLWLCCLQVSNQIESKRTSCEIGESNCLRKHQWRNLADSLCILCLQGKKMKKWKVEVNLCCSFASRSSDIINLPHRPALATFVFDPFLLFPFVVALFPCKIVIWTQLIPLDLSPPLELRLLCRRYPAEEQDQTLSFQTQASCWQERDSNNCVSWWF